MDTKNVVIDEKTMEMLMDIAERNGRSLEEEIRKYNYYITDGRKKLAGMGKMSPSLAALVGICGKVPDNYDWKKDVEEGLCEKYIR